MSKTMWGVIILIVLVLAGTIVLDVHKIQQAKKRMAAFKAPAQVVETIQAKAETWHPRLYSVGTLTAINGVSVSSEVSGQVTKIHFHSGDEVKKGKPLVQLDDSFDRSQLRNDVAALELARIQFTRQSQLIKTGATSQSDLDEAHAKLKQLEADVAGDQVKVSKKAIHAPFAGKVGIRLINLGEYVNAGQALVSLQSMDPLFIDFYLPEQDLKEVRVGQPVKVSITAYPKQVFDAKLIALNSTVDANTRNFQVRAEVPNPKKLLYPGVFANVFVQLPEQKNVITLPQTAIAYTLYGDSVYVIKHEKDKSGKDTLRAVSQSITLGKQRGSVVQILSGLKPEDQVISAGQVKIQNNSLVTINNKMRLKE